MINIRPTKGITLIETIIAVFILAVGITGVLYMFPMGTQIAKSSQMATIAIQLVQAKAEEKISESYDELLIATTTEGYGEIDGFSAYKRVTKINCVHPLDLSEIFCDYDFTYDPFPMKKIEITVYWKSPLGVTTRDINLVSLIAKR